MYSQHLESQCLEIIIRAQSSSTEQLLYICFTMRRGSLLASLTTLSEACAVFQDILGYPGFTDGFGTVKIHTLLEQQLKASQITQGRTPIFHLVEIEV